MRVEVLCIYVTAVGEGRGDCYQCTLDVNFNNSSVNGFSLLAPVLVVKVTPTHDSLVVAKA